MCPRGWVLIPIADWFFTIKSADSIIFMNALDIVKQGTHADLNVRNGTAANLLDQKDTHAFQENEVPSRTSTVVESLAALISIEKHGVDPADLTQTTQKQARNPRSPRRDGGIDTDKSTWCITKRTNVMVRTHSLRLLLTAAAAFIIGCTYSVPEQQGEQSFVQRIYMPGAGTIEMDGANISRPPTISFRDDMAVFPQGSAHFDGRVRFNVGRGARSTPRAQGRCRTG
ncbi:hypothetical protein LX36DRAFT_706983 [Colletotrichum falcatum]|nr:hypothetical protein LX36DRAFT_706983 [Colletotrichum falcatum]